MTHEPHHQRCTELSIGGMTCSSCEIMLERKLKKITGVLDVRVDHRTGKVRIIADAQALPDADQIEEVIFEAGYRLEDGSYSGIVAGLDVERGVWKVAIDGMTCQSCERLLRQRLRMVPGVRNASVHYERGTANVYFVKGQRPLWEDLQEAVESDGYFLRRLDEEPSVVEPPHQRWMEVGGAFLVIFALYKLLRAFDVAALSSLSGGAATYGGIFLIGLVAGTSSCLAVTGGLLLSVAAKYNEVNRSRSAWEKFKPLLSFNVGRLVSYAVLGGLVGVLGKSITLTPGMTGVMNIVVAFVMLYLALSILKVIPKGGFPIRPPRRLSHWIADLSENPHPAAPFSLGALTFFLPCGFTQSLQLAALASGSFLTGSLTMFIFALGTLPALLGISAISSTAKGVCSRLFLRFSGALVFVLALWNLNNGLLLTGVDAKQFLPSALSASPQYAAGSDPNVTQTSDGQQILNLHVTPYGYVQKSFTVAAGKPTWIYATADAGIGGCTSGLTVPKYRLAKILQPGSPDPQTGKNVLGPFTPSGDLRLACAMGMLSVPIFAEGGVVAAGGADAAVAPTAQVPGNAQVVQLKWTSSGYEPRFIRVKDDRPTALVVSSEVPTGGCMSFLQFREFDQATAVPAPGQEPAVLVLATDRAQPGRYPGLCSMGAAMMYIEVESA